MNQDPTISTTAEATSTLPARPATTAPAAAALAAAASPRPALRVRYWEHMDPASKSLYPVD